MSKLKPIGPPISETLSHGFLLLVINTLFPNRVNTYPVVEVGGDSNHHEVTEEKVKTACEKMKNDAEKSGPDGLRISE